MDEELDIDKGRMFQTHVIECANVLETHDSSAKEIKPSFLLGIKENHGEERGYQDEQS